MPALLRAHWHPWIDRPLGVLVTLVIAVLARMLLHRAISRVVAQIGAGTDHDRPGERRAGLAILERNGLLLASERRRQRVEAVGSLLRSVASFVIFAISLFTIIGEFGQATRLEPLIASAGVIGVALAFGAQNLVRDFLSGIFMIIEDQYGVGDLVNVGEVTGTVEEVGLRVTRLRDAGGIVWYVRNGEIPRVGNESQGWARAIVDVPVAYSEDLPRVKALIKQTADELAGDPQFDEAILEPPEVAGVESMTGDALVIRVVIKTGPARHAEVARELRARLKTTFDQAGIRVPTSIGPTSAGTAVPPG
jgi:small conductance mechanosensitive channel